NVSNKPLCSLCVQIDALKTFHRYTIENVLRLGKNSLKPEFGPGASNGNFVIVPVNQIPNDLSGRGIDWDFVDLIVKHKAETEAAQSTPKPTTPVLSEAIDKPIEEEASPKEKFEFKPELYTDAVIIPKYRRDKM